MAITKILARSARIDRIIQYVLNGDKTDGQILTAHQNCDPGRECRQMLDTKREVGKMGGRQCYHIIQSFKPGEKYHVTTQEYYRLGFRLRGQDRFMYPGRRNGLFTEEGIRAAIEGNLAAIESGLRPAVVRRPPHRLYRKHPKYTGLLALYVHYLYVLGKAGQRQCPPRATPPPSGPTGCLPSRAAS